MKMSANHAIERTADPRHASCGRTCRATGRGPLIADVRPRTLRQTGNTMWIAIRAIVAAAVAGSLLACTTRDGMRQGTTCATPADVVCDGRGDKSNYYMIAYEGARAAWCVSDCLGYWEVYELRAMTKAKDGGYFVPAMIYPRTSGRSLRYTIGNRDGADEFSIFTADGYETTRLGGHFDMDGADGATPSSRADAVALFKKWLIQLTEKQKEKEAEQSAPPVSGTRGTPAAYAPAAPGIPER